MKKIIVSLVCLFTFATANAQWNSGTGTKDISFGPRVALGMSNLNTDGEMGDWKFSYSVGAFMNFRLYKGIYFHPELNFVSKGSQKEVDYMLKKITYKTNISYIEIPVLAKFSMGSASLLAGPYFAFKISDDFKGEGSILPVIKPDFESTDIGLSGGVEVTLPSNLTADFRINYGLTEIYKDSKSHNINLLVGIAYHL